MWNLARCSCALLIASFAMALGAAAEEQEWQADGSDFVRTGFYLGAGGTAGFPQNWDNDFDNDLNEPATEQENQSAQDALDLINATRPRRDRLSLVPNSVMVTGTDLEDVLMGVNGVIGYRAGPRVPSRWRPNG